MWQPLITENGKVFSYPPLIIGRNDPILGTARALEISPTSAFRFESLGVLL